MTSRGQRARTGVLLRMVRMMRGAGAWRGLGGTVTGGAPRAQVGAALTILPLHLSFDKCLLYGLFQNKIHFKGAPMIGHRSKYKKSITIFLSLSRTPFVHLCVFIAAHREK